MSPVQLVQVEDNSDVGFEPFQQQRASNCATRNRPGQMTISFSGPNGLFQERPSSMRGLQGVDAKPQHFRPKDSNVGCGSEVVQGTVDSAAGAPLAYFLVLGGSLGGLLLLKKLLVIAGLL